MIKVAPSILSADYLNLQDNIEKVESDAEYLHIDIMDGSFVPSISYGPAWVKAIRSISNLKLDVHMMVQNPEKLINTFANNGADVIGVHKEATPHIHRALQMIKNAGVRAEVVINPGTSVEAIKPVLYMVDQVLVMTVNPGFGGQKFIPEMINKIKQLNNIKKENNYNFDIEIDGGVNEQTVQGAYNAGATIGVAGSYVFNNDNPSKQIQNLKNVTK